MIGAFNMDSITTITTCTRDCPNTCGLEATVENGKLVSLKGAKNHPFTRGRACHKTTAYIKRVYSPERITHPMIKRDGTWQRADWDEALDLVGDKIKEIIRENGPEAILYYQGYGERTALKLLNGYFFNLLGGVTTLRGSLCGGTGEAAQNLDLGKRISHDPLDHYNSKAMILWARNPVTTNTGLVPIIQDVKKRGGRIITIDPFKNRSASLSDRHIAPAPNRDGFLAMAAAKIICDAGGVDNDFVEHHANGFAAYKAIIDRYTIDELCKEADVSNDDAHYLAETLMRYKPTSILLGWGLHRHKDAHLSIRAIDALAAISGNIGVEGGGVSQGFDEYGPYDQKWWGHELNSPRRKLMMPEIGKEIMKASNPKLRMAFISAANPVCMAPDSDSVKKAFTSLELVVYCGQFMDDTAECADIFLPATTFLEEDDVMATFGSNYVGPVNKAIEPVGECKSDYHMFCELAKRFDFADRFIRDNDQWLSDICRPILKAGCPLADLRKRAFRMPLPMAPYLDKIFPTPSGKFEFMQEFDSTTLMGDSYDYPYTLLTIAPHDFICSERTMADHPPLPQVVLHPDEAKRLDVKDGGIVMIKSCVGAIKALLRTDAATRKDCLIAERGGWIKAGHELNRLTSPMVSTLGEGTPYYDTKVSVTRSNKSVS